jgi:hypothetical protein
MTDCGGWLGAEILAVDGVVEAPSRFKGDAG